MKIRVINENDWEKAYDFDKTIIRVGSQPNCDIQLKGNGIQPLQLQLVRTAGKNTGYMMRIFADNVTVMRGEQSFPGKKMVPYEVLDGDKLNFGIYRLVISIGDEQTRVRKSAHIEAEMALSKRELSPDSPINGILVLKNTGTEKACQFRMHISGLPNECLQLSPLPFIYPGGSSSVGFIISHLRTKPEPGFVTVSITLSAPEEYQGETLEFNQDIYVEPVFQNEFILEDDAADLSGFKMSAGRNLTESAPEPYKPVFIPDLSPVSASAEKSGEKAEKADLSDPVVVKSGKSFDGEEETEEETPVSGRPRRKTKKSPIVIRNSGDAFDEDEPVEKPEADLASSEGAEAAVPASDPESGAEEKTEITDPAPEAKPEKAAPESAEETETEPEKTDTPKRRKKAERAPKTPEKPETEALPEAAAEEILPAEKPETAETKTNDVDAEPPAAEAVIVEEENEPPAEQPVPAASLPDEKEEPAEVPVIPAADARGKKKESSRKKSAPVSAVPVKADEFAAEMAAPEAEAPEKESKLTPSAETEARDEKPEQPAHDQEMPSEPSSEAEPDAGMSTPEEKPEAEVIPQQEILTIQPAREITAETPEPGDKTDEKPAEETPAGRKKKSASVKAPKPEEPSVITHADRDTSDAGTPPVPVVYINHSMDFSDEGGDEGSSDDTSAAEDQNPVVRFVKGGQFDD